MFPWMYLKGILILFFFCYIGNLMKLLISWNMKFKITRICIPKPWAYIWLKNRLPFILFETKVVFLCLHCLVSLDRFLHISIQRSLYAFCDSQVICRKSNVYKQTALFSYKPPWMLFWLSFVSLSCRLWLLDEMWSLIKKMKCLDLQESVIQRSHCKLWLFLAFKDLHEDRVFASLEMFLPLPYFPLQP